MKRKLKKLFNDIFGWHILLGVGIFFVITHCFQNTSNFIIKMLYLVMVAISISYFLSSNHHKLDRKNDNNKIALIIRSIVYRLLTVVIFKCLTSFGIEINKNFIDLFFLLLSYSLIFSLLAIMMGIKLRTLFVLMIVFLPILLLLGAFDIKWWALVTGFITLWNFINSEDFLTYLRVGKELKDVPRELKYKWSINKLVIYIFTFLFYLSLVISSFFEKKTPYSFEDYLNNGAIRVYSMLSLIILLIILCVLLFGYYYLLNREEKEGRVVKHILKIGEKIGLKRFNNTIQLYIKAKKGELK